MTITSSITTKVPAFKPTNFVTLLGLPSNSYRNSCTQKILGSPYSRKLIFYRFKLADTVPKIKSLMKQHKIYADYEIDVDYTKAQALVVTLICNKAKTSQLSPETTNDYDKDEFSKIKLVTKNLVGNYFKCDAVPTDNGYEFLFCDVRNYNICSSVVKNLEKRYSNFTIRGELGDAGFYLFMDRKDNGNLLLPYGLKELLPENAIEQHSNTVDAIPIKNQIINAVHYLMTAGMSIKTIRDALDCSDSDMIELLDIHSPILLYPSIQKLSKLSNTTFTI